MSDYLDLEDPGEEMQDARHSSQVEVTTQANEMEDVEVIEIHEAPVMDAPLPIALVDKPATKMSLVETTIFELTPPIKAVVTEHVATAEPLSTETPQGEAAKFNIATSTLARKNHNFFGF